MAVAMQSAVPERTWDEEIVPALRKRLKDESAILTKRMSASSIRDGSADQKQQTFSSLAGQIMASSSRTNMDNYNYAVGQTRFPDIDSAPRISTSNSSSTTRTIPRPSGIPRPSLGGYSPEIEKEQESFNLDTSYGDGDHIRTRKRTISTPTPFDKEKFIAVQSKLGDQQGSSALPTPASSRANSPVMPMSAGLPYAHTRMDPSVSRSRIPLPRPSLGPQGSGSTTNLAMINGSDRGLDSPSSASYPELIREPLPHQLMASNGVIDTPRESMEEERQFEHWYRGDVSRSGGVGELRVGKRKEMLDIANYGHFNPISRPASSSLDVIVDQRLGSRKRRGSFAEKGSVHIVDESDGRAITEWMLDEMPLTDGERYSESSAADDPTIRTGIALGGAGYQNGYYGSRSDESETEHQLPTPTEHGSSRNMPSGVIGVARAIGKPSLQPGRRPIKAGPASLIPSAPKSKTSNSSLSAASGSKSGTTPRSFTAPLPLPDINGQNRARGLSASSSSSSKLPSSSQSLSQKRARTTSGVSQRKRGGSRSTPSAAAAAATGPEESAPPLPRPQLDASGRPLSTLENAIPSWSVPVPKDGNWDEMVLPVVAKQMGLEDYEEVQVNGGQQTPARKGPPPNIYSPAPGTFGYNDPKYRPPRDDIQMDEFGAAASHAQRPKPAHARRQTPPSPAPFARYQHDPRSPPPQVPLHSGTEGPRILLQPPTMASTEERTRIEPPAEEESSGCCKCVIM